MKNLNQYILESLKGYKQGDIKPKEQLPEDCTGYFVNQKVDVDDIENLDTSKVTNMKSMFERANFDSDSLDLSSYDVSNVTSMNSMFYHCKSLEALDLSSWDTSNVTDVSGMFDGCDSLKFLDVSGWDTSNVTDVSGVFYGCYGLTDIKFGPGWFKSNNMTKFAFDLNACGMDEEFKLSDETYESMLTMYDRKKARLKPVSIYFDERHNIPDGFKEKMKERGYIVKIY